MGAPTHQNAAAARAGARQDRSELRAALVSERAGYVQRGRDDGIAAVDAQLAALDEDDLGDVDDEDIDAAEIDTLRAALDELVVRNIELGEEVDALRAENERLIALVPDVPSTFPEEPAVPAEPATPVEESVTGESPKGRQRRSAAAAAEPKAD
ncbi:hypothetical protein ACFWGN_16175 [Oerskovia sp. NPDC060338]|uniref:hypothetical protein n=1 Tax=Oerskovia sp. NPDC060338 TaxID=3347100 RepID=UPI003657CCD4